MKRSATEEIERIYHRAVQNLQVTLQGAIQEASSYTRPSELVEAQQLYIKRLRLLSETLGTAAKLPLTAELPLSELL